jgi:hypothetical protein
MMVPLTSRFFLIAAGVVLAATGTAPAGWISIKNETRSAVVLHDVPDGPAGKRGRVVRLLPGEVYREYQPRAGEKRVQVLETRGQSGVLFEATLKWPAGDVSLRIRKEGDAVTLDPVRPARPEGAVAVVSVPGKPKR